MGYLFSAYLAIWVLIFGYTLLLGRREKQTREELLVIRKTLEKRGS